MVNKGPSTQQGHRHKSRLSAKARPPPASSGFLLPGAASSAPSLPHRVLCSFSGRRRSEHRSLVTQASRRPPPGLRIFSEAGPVQHQPARLHRQFLAVLLQLPPMDARPDRIGFRIQRRDVDGGSTRCAGCQSECPARYRRRLDEPGISAITSAAVRRPSQPVRYSV
jgi:hypothetical protein